MVDCDIQIQEVGAPAVCVSVEECDDFVHLEIEAPQVGVEVLNGVNINSTGTILQRSSFGYDFVSDDQYTQENPLVLQPNVRTLVSLQNNGGRNVLQGNYTNHEFLQNGRIFPRIRDEDLLFRLNFDGESALSNNILITEIDGGGFVGVADSDESAFNPNAAVPRRFTPLFTVFAGQVFLVDDGFEIYMRSPQQCSLWNFSIKFSPLSEPL